MPFLPSFLLEPVSTGDATNSSTKESSSETQHRVGINVEEEDEGETDDGGLLLRRREMPSLPSSPLVYPPPRPAQPPLGVTGIMCQEGQASLRRGVVGYRVFRPRYMTCHQRQPSSQPSSSSSSSAQGSTTTNNNRPLPSPFSSAVPIPPPPLIVLQGGPGMPSPYLFPLAHVVTDRAIIFYDPLGCGSSAILNTTTPDGCFTLSNMVQDLAELIRDHWKLCRFHLYGHSFGGILAFEYLLTQQQRQKQQHCGCQSVILASTPTSTDLVESESLRLLQQLQDQQPKQHHALSKSRLLELFRQQHVCRVQPPPLAILDACWHAANLLKRQFFLQHQQQQDAAAVDSTISPNRNDATQSKSASLSSTTNSSSPAAWYSYSVPSQPAATADVAANTTTAALPPALILWGQYDFVTERCVEQWNDYPFISLQKTLLANCSHYGMWEEETLYGNVVSAFLQDCDGRSITTTRPPQQQSCQTPPH